ncbi:hypothetical protein PUMCH_004497 [Australozyma saopauloensis]|uniref:V-type ATPase assembly factor PKR1 n=1 Tax=Australozyma saopauloensis TaxID=291208 RepID=A0AAX4HFH8_9ASCO|nr:hypothetical protein PUMCH_004497 [[Candida] saopauloensis]
MSFFVELWESIFTPGTSPALLKATHGSFVLLLMSLLFLIYYTRSIHFVNLFVIAALLYALVIWFVAELQRAKLMNNSELQLESGDKNTVAEGESVENVKKTEKTEKMEKAEPLGAANTGAAAAKSTPRKRKA